MLATLLATVYIAAAPADSRFRVVPLAPGAAIPYFIAEASAGSQFRTGDSQLAEWATQEWTRATGSVVRFERVEIADTALLRFLWLPWAEDAALGHMDRVTVDGRERAFITVRPDEGRFRPSIRRGVADDPLLRDVVVYYVCLHEVGHALGLSHSDNPRDVMWPGNNGVTLAVYERYRHLLQTRDDIPRTSWLSSGDVMRFKAIWRAEHGGAQR